MSIETKAALLGLAAGLAVLGGTFGLSPFLQRATAAAAKEQSTNIASAATSPTLEGAARRGHSHTARNRRPRSHGRALPVREPCKTATPASQFRCRRHR